MAISITKYIDIISSKIGTSIAVRKDMILRVFTDNSLLPPLTLITFETADEVGDYFGTTSEEYYRAVFYFSWVSKNNTTPQKIQYARWCKSASLPKIYPLQENGTALGNWTGISAGSFVLTMGGFTFAVSDMDFSAAGSLAAVAGIIEDAIQAKTGGGAAWTAATVTYSSSYGGFILTGGTGTTVTQEVSVNVGGGDTDITPEGLLGWIPEQVVTSDGYIPGAIWAPGSDAETITETLTASADASSNFASFLFLNNLDLTLTNVEDAATWNDTVNNEYCFLNLVTAANASSWYTSLNTIGGLGLTLSGLTTTKVGTLANASPTVTNLNSTDDLKVGQEVSGSNIPANTTILAINSSSSITLSANATAGSSQVITFLLVEFPEQIPSIIAAATDYSAKNSVQNYEYQTNFNVTASVTTTSTATAYDDLRINYYGVTQSNGKLISFYQQGFLMGGSSDVIDMGPYYNEIWLKDAMRTDLLNMQLGLSQVPANNSGVSMISTTLQGVITEALNNGTISVGKTLTSAQKAAITAVTGNSNSWQTVTNSGYVLSVSIVLEDEIYIAKYTLIYSEGDSIRKINGTHDIV